MKIMQAEPNGTGLQTPVTGTTTATETFTWDLLSTGRGGEGLVVIPMVVTGTMDIDVTGGADLDTLQVVSDVTGRALTNIAASETYIVDITGMRYIVFTVTESTGTFDYAVLHI